MAVSSILNRLPRLAGNHSWTPLLIGGLFLGVGALVGLVVATGNLILKPWCWAASPACCCSTRCRSPSG